MVDRATKYALDVVEGKLERAVGRTERLACERHLRDLERQGTSEFPYVWEREQAHVLIDFAETLTLAEGNNPAPLELWGFQDFIFGSWHGWRDLEGYRRFKTSYVQLGRQNGKSLGNAVPSMYYGNFDGYMYPQIYATATKADQAWIVAKECVKFINADPELSGTQYEDGLFTVREYLKKIICNLTGGEIIALGRDTKTIDGFRPYYGSVDEYHLHLTDQMFRLLLDGCRNLHEYLISIITTAGFDLTVPCYEEYLYSKQILEGAVEHESRFVFITEPDKEIMDKPGGAYTVEAQQMANPLWTPQKEKNLADAAKEAKAKGGEALRNYLTKGLNWWVQFADDQYMNLEHWKNCESDMSLENVRGGECVLGLDLSSGGDLTTGVLEFDINIDGERKYFIYSHSFIPVKRVAEHVKSDHAPYDMWIKAGLLTPTQTMGGVKTDYKYILSHFKYLIDKYDLKLKGIAYDPHNADAFLSDLDETFGVDCVEIKQSARSLNDATVDFRLEVEAGNVIYNKGEKLLSWSVANAKTESNSFGEIKIVKGEPGKRIDPVDAVIDAHKLMLSLNETTFDVAQAANDYLEMMGW